MLHAVERDVCIPHRLKVGSYLDLCSIDKN